MVKWIIGGLIFITLVGLSFYSGYKFRESKIPKLSRDSVSVHLNPLPPQHAEFHTVKPGKVGYQVKPVSSKLTDSTYKDVTYTEVIDSIITFKSDSLDFVAEIVFNDSTKTFDNYFDFNLRLKEKVTEIFREVPIFYQPEIWQNPFVIVLGIITAFLFGVVI